MAAASARGPPGGMGVALPGVSGSALPGEPGEIQKGPGLPGPEFHNDRLQTTFDYGVVYAPFMWQVRQSSEFWSLRQRRLSPVLPVLCTEWQEAHSSWVLPVP